MGFFDDVGEAFHDVNSTIGGAVNNTPVIGDIHRGVNNLIPGANQFNQWAGIDPMAPGGPGESPEAAAARLRRQQLIDQQQGQLERFDKDKQGMLDRAISSGDRATRQALDNRMRGIKNDASRRGLLNSGITEAAKANASVGAAQQFAGNRENLNKSFMSAREKMQNLLNRLKFNQQEEAVIQADSVYDQALNEANQDRGAMGNIMGTLGSGAGMLAGSQSQSSQAPAPAPQNTSYNQSSGYGGLDLSGQNSYSADSDRRRYA